MTSKTAYLVPDTNLFEQCEPLHQLDWSAWSDYDEVRILVTDPVMEEIDRHKAQGNSRVARKSRIFSALLNEILDADQLTKIVREERPRVVLELCPHIAPTASLHPSFDYTRADHRLVGCAHALSAFHEPLWLLSGDSRPKAAALMIGLARKPIPDTWLLKPEPDERDKENAALRQERDRLLKAEPVLTADAVDGQGKAIGIITGELTVFEAMTTSEIDDIIDRLKHLYPQAKDFGLRERQTRRLRSDMGLAIALTGLTETFEPATEAEISNYENEAYPGWIQGCRTHLRGLHDALQAATPWPPFAFRLANTGTRAAEHTLVTLEARGNFMLMTPPREPDPEDDPPAKTLELPKPPKPPKGRWRTHSISSMLDLYGMQRGSIVPVSPFRNMLASLPDRTRDVHAFYYTPERPSEPVQKYALTCEQWLHGTPMSLGGHFIPAESADELRGEVVCSLRAANASSTYQEKITVRIKVVRKSASTEVERLLMAM
ncbi:MAG: PIN domain-containing protein [Hyphomicrobiaceae bacterium]